MLGYDGNAAAYRRFATAEENRRLRQELAVTVVAVLVVLGVVAWALTL